jgi:hypothetical protein
MLFIAIGRQNERLSEEVGLSRSTLSLSVTERTALDRLCHPAAQPYLRERAAAIRKVADGQSAPQVARAGRLPPRQVATVCRWLARSRAAGVAGLTIRSGRGRQPAVSPAAARRGGRPRGAPRRPAP